MAQKIVRELVCDLTGDPADETVLFGLAGKTYEVDLTRHHADALKEILADYINVARTVSNTTSVAPTRRRAGGSAPASRDREQTRAIREWAKAQGRSVSDRGRIPAQVVADWEAAHRLSAVG